MSVFDEKISEKLKAVFSNLQDQVNILYFTQEIECGTCREAGEFIREISAFNKKMTLTEYDFLKHSNEAKKYNVDKIPAIVILDKNKEDTGIKFYGIPGGYEINSFIETLIEVSGRKKPMDSGLLARIQKIDKPVHIQVLISLQCPYCPDAVHAGNIIALENSMIRSEMIDAAEFPHLAGKYNVTSVPKTIINETHEFTGAIPVDKIIETIESALR
jgi:glutaredoxin-like protein